MTATYRVHVTREGRYWVGVVEGLPGGATETRMLSDLENEVRDLISGLTDTDPDDVTLDVDMKHALPSPAIAAVNSAQEWRAKLRTAEREYSDAQQAAVQRLTTTDGVSVRDVAILLGVSPGRVSRAGRGPRAKSSR